jgi:protein-tyrosine phosphatase
VVHRPRWIGIQIQAADDRVIRLHVASGRNRRALCTNKNAMKPGFVDIHCHLLPGIDDGATDWDESLAMARLAVDDGTTAIIATPHQLGSFRHNHAGHVRSLVAELQDRLSALDLPLIVLPGGDVRIEEDIVNRVATGEVLTLGDRGKHILMEQPHELLLPLEPVLARLARYEIVGILSHPERNEGVLRRPDVLIPLVDAGCLMQITAGSLCGSFGPDCQQLAEWMLVEGLAHFVATDAHGVRSRRPLMRRAYERIVELTDAETADDLCRHNPKLVADGKLVQPGRRRMPCRPGSWWRRKTVA